MASASISLFKYASSSMETVQGYLTSLDARLIAALLSYQEETCIQGNLCEIGVHHGRLFLMLALARRQEERALAIDLFEDDAINANTRHAGRDRALLSNARRLGIDLSDEETFKTSSLDINANDILQRTTGPVRFFSIDGSHRYNAVENDLRLAEKTLGVDGIIAVDDFFNRDWADASFATYDFLRTTDTIVPFAITSKLFLAPPEAAERYKVALGKRDDVARAYSVEFLGRDVLAFRQSVLNKGYEMLRGLRMRRAS
jgi:hypothetical protein